MSAPLKAEISRETVTAVRRWVEAHPRCSSRDVALGVFGNGHTRTTERCYAGQILRVLAALGLLIAEHGRSSALNGANHLVYFVPPVCGCVCAIPDPVLAWCRICNGHLPQSRDGTHHESCPYKDGP